MSDTRASTAVIFDLDGVLTDTAELHYQSWCLVAQELGIAFSRQQNEALRGVSRMKSCDLMLGERRGDYSDVEKAEIARKKNDAYLALVAQMSAQDLLPGAEALLKSIRAAGMKTAVASASRNGHTVLARLGIGELLDVALDGNDVPASKPAPDLFLTAAEQMGVFQFGMCGHRGCGSWRRGCSASRNAGDRDRTRGSGWAGGSTCGYGQ
jgi:beta-phosphoglucomutase